MCEYMSTDKQYDGQLIEEYFRLDRIREKAVLENALETIKLIDREMAFLKLKLKNNLIQLVNLRYNTKPRCKASFIY